VNLLTSNLDLEMPPIYPILEFINLSLRLDIPSELAFTFSFKIRYIFLKKSVRASVITQHTAAYPLKSPLK